VCFFYLNYPQESSRPLSSNALTDMSATRCPSDWCLNALCVVLFLRSHSLERHGHAPCNMLVGITEGSDLCSHSILKTRFVGLDDCARGAVLGSLDVLLCVLWCGILVPGYIISKHTLMLSIIWADMRFTFRRVPLDS
jgi:hypothetical protein